MNIKGTSIWEGTAVVARLDTVCKFVCEVGDWNVSNLRLQKVLYIAQMFYMGRNNGDRLVDATFEAWDYGPVVPALYHKVKMFGSRPIADVFYDALRFNEDDRRRMFLMDVCIDLLHRRPGELVEITHWENGAWAKNYAPGIRGIEIPDADIIAEFYAWLQDGRIKPPS